MGIFPKPRLVLPRFQFSQQRESDAPKIESNASLPPTAAGRAPGNSLPPQRGRIKWPPRTPISANHQHPCRSGCRPMDREAQWFEAAGSQFCRIPLRREGRRRKFRWLRGYLFFLRAPTGQFKSPVSLSFSAARSRVLPVARNAQKCQRSPALVPMK